jgi:glycosyltransferase involved in cell wall biosynthesis
VNPDFIYCSHINFSPVCLFLKKIFGFNYVVTAYNEADTEIIKSSLYKKSLESAIYIICLFGQTKKIIIKQISNIESKIIFLPNSINGDIFCIKEKSEKLIKKYNLESKKVILTVARLSYQEVNNKGYEAIIRMMPDILKKVGDAKYMLVGGGNDFERIEKLVQDLGLNDNIILTGAVSDLDLVDYYNLADVFVLLSRNEGFPAIVLLEALACGKPIIGGRQGELSENFFTDNCLGFIVDANNQKQAVKAIVDVLNKNELMRFLNSSILRSKVIKEYGVDSFNERVKNFLHKSFF